jgi:hypothetical protein
MLLTRPRQRDVHPRADLKPVLPLCRCMLHPQYAPRRSGMVSEAVGVVEELADAGSQL